MDLTPHDSAAGTTRPVHNTTLADDEDCRPKDTYEELLTSGYLVGVRDYLAGPRLERFARGADEAGYTLLATSDRDTLLAVVHEARHRLTLPAADLQALQMTVAMLCSNPPVCTVHGALLALLLDLWGLDGKEVMQAIIFHLQHVPAQRTSVQQVVEHCLKLIPGEQLEIQLAETLRSLFPLSLLHVGSVTNLASPSTYGLDAPSSNQQLQSSDCGSSSGHHSTLCAEPDLFSLPSLAQPAGGTPFGTFVPVISAPSSTYGFGAPYSPYRVPLATRRSFSRCGSQLCAPC